MEIVTVESSTEGRTHGVQGDALKKAKEKIEDHMSEIKSKIHRFPVQLQGISISMNYIAPRMVAIGPYYHGRPEVRAMEELKRMAACCFCEGLPDSPEQVYKKILPVASRVRGCYVDADADALQGITDDDIAAMMFFDGCFLVQCFASMFTREYSPLRDVIHNKGAGVRASTQMTGDGKSPEV